MSCTDITETSEISGSAEGTGGWFRLGKVVVTLDSGIHTQAQYAVNIEFVNGSDSENARAAVELVPESAKRLAEVIQAALSRGARDGILGEA